MVMGVEMGMALGMMCLGSEDEWRFQCSCVFFGGGFNPSFCSVSHFSFQLGNFFCPQSWGRSPLIII